MPEWEKVLELASVEEQASEYQDVWSRLAWGYLRTHHEELAEQTVWKALKVLPPGNFRRVILRILFRQYASTHRLDTLRQSFESALQQDPTDRVALFDLSRLYDHQGDSLKALELYEKAVVLKPEDVQLCQDMIDACQKMPGGHPSEDEAARLREVLQRKELAALDRLSRLDPEKLNMERMFWLYDRLGERDAALAFIQRWIASDSQNASVYITIGNTYARWQMFEEAIAAYQHAIAFPNPRIRWGGYQDLADVYEETGDHEKAIEVLTSLENLDPEGDVQLEVRWVWAVVNCRLRILGKQEADVWLQRWVAVHPDRPETHVIAA